MAARRVVAAVAANQAEQVEELTLQLAGVQRNYDSMSRMMQMKQQEIEQTRLLLEVERAEAATTRGKLQNALVRASAGEAAALRAAALPGELAALQAEYDRLQLEAGQANSKVSAATGSLANVRMAAEELEHRASLMKRELEGNHIVQALAAAELAASRKQTEEALRDGRGLSSELRALRDTLARAQALAQAAEQRASTSASRANSLEEQLASSQDTGRTQRQRMAEDSATQRALDVSLAASRGKQQVLEAQLRTAERAAELGQQERDALAGQVVELRHDLDTSRESLSHASARSAQLEMLVSDAEDRCQGALTAGVSTNEVVTGLTVQLAQAKAMAGEARRELHEQSEAHAALTASLHAAAHAAAQRALESSNRMRQAAHRSSDFAMVLIARVETLMERLVALQGSIDRDLQEGLGRHEKELTAIGYKLQQWEESASTCVDALGGMGGGLSTLHTQSVFRHSKAAREVSTAKGDVAALSGRAADLAAALSVEQAARKALSEAKQRQEADYAKAIKSIRAAADERVEDERRRLAAKLTAVESAMAGLQAAHERDRQAEAQALEMERVQLRREGVALREQIARLHAGLSDAHEGHRAGLDARQTAEDAAGATAAAFAAAAARRALDMQTSLAQLQGYLKNSWDVALKLLEDMQVVRRHLVKMGLEVSDGTLNDGESLPSPDGDGGQGFALTRASALLRLRFSYITEAVQALAVKGGMLSPAPPPLPSKVEKVLSATDWTALARELRSAVAKVLHVEEALATNCTCLACLDIFKNPVTCVPCGHTFCRRCLDKAHGLCAECDLMPDATVDNAPLDAICSKADYKLSALKSISKAINKGVT